MGRSVKTSLIASCAIAALALFAAAPAWATEEHTYDPVLSLTGSTAVSAEDEVPDPGPSHPAKPFQEPCGVATDPHGDIYVATPAVNNEGKGPEGRIDVFNPQGEYLTEIPDGRAPCGLAVDSEGEVYVWEYEAQGSFSQRNAELYEADSYPPTKETKYSLAKVFEFPHQSGSDFCANVASVAVDPSNDHLYIGHNCRIEEYGSAAEGLPLIKENVATGVTALTSRMTGMDVYGRNHDVYTALPTNLNNQIEEPNEVRVYDGSDGQVKCHVGGTGEPGGEFGFSLGASIAVDQANGDFYVYDNEHKVIDQFDEECKFIGRLPTEPPKLRPTDLPYEDLAVDDPIEEGEAGYDSPNEGYVYATSGTKAANSHLFGFAPVAPPEFSLALGTTGSGSGTVECEVNSGPAEECATEYPEGTELTLIAAADPGSEFLEWSEDCSGSGGCELTMDEAHSATAIFDLEPAVEDFPLTVTKTGAGTVTSEPAGILCGAFCTAAYEAGTVVTLSASPEEGSTFSGWSGACSGTGTCEVTMSEARAVQASFASGFALSVAKEGPGAGIVASDPAGILCGEDLCEASFEAGTMVTLTASPSTGSMFSSWKGCDKGGVNGRECKVTMSAAKSVSARFIKSYAVTLNKAGSGLGKVSSSPGGVLCLANCTQTTGEFKEGTKVTVKETPSKHFHFVEWSGDCTGAGPCELTMGANHEVEAAFAPDTRYSLALTKTGPGSGTVKSAPAGANCGPTCLGMTNSFYEGEVVVLTASVQAGKGSTFAGWTGEGCSGTGTCTVTMSSAKSITAEFE